VKDRDLSDEIKGRVEHALVTGTPLQILGGGTKSFYGREARGESLSLFGHRGVLDYRPTELVITARAGTPLREIEAALSERGQMLGFEPPHFGRHATLGGAVAAGLSGSRRPFAGAVRDFVLGVTLVNGRGEILRFGGTVMKNVAGFDVSRLMAGSLGTLGVLLDLSLKVLPKPIVECTLVFDLAMNDALIAVNQWCGQCLPISGACYGEGRLCVRLSGEESALRRSAALMGGEVLEAGPQFWLDLREQRLGYFSGAENLWRLSLPPAHPMPDLPGVWLIDWAGGLRWLKSDAQAETIFAMAAKAGGHACRFRGAPQDGSVFQPLPVALGALQRRVKQAFDPVGIFNPGRLYADW
jgi:glycolate oxidase FAD binding subunit